LSSATVSAVDADAAIAGALKAPAIVGGTATIFMTRSYIANMFAHDIVIAPVNPWEHSTQEVNTTTTWLVRGGDLDLRTGAGSLYFDGSTIVTNVVSGQSLVLWDITFNLANHSIDYTWRTPDGDVLLHGLELPGDGSGQVIGTNGSYIVKELFMSRENGAAMNDLLGTKAFEDESVFGGFAAQFKLKEAASTDGVVEWGKR
jgi:hypothetical protein